MGIQGVKDTFYLALRDRVAMVNGARTTVVRGVVRPAVVVAENELPGAAVDGIAPVETFCLRWTELRVDAQGLIAARCEIRYATDGSAGVAGMDRGRVLGTMDAELVAALNGAPQHADGVQLSEPVAGAAEYTATRMRVFWSDVQPGPVTVRGERLERVAAVEVFGYGQ